jgi:DNA-binding NarL/FixJ family response regulator
MERTLDDKAAILSTINAMVSAFHNGDIDGSCGLTTPLPWWSAELAAMAGSGTLCPDAVRAVLGAAQHSAAAPLRPSGLTERDVEVLRLVARGLTNKEIGAALGISPKTAGHHVQHLFERLGVRTRAAATMIAMQRGPVASHS